MNKNHQAPRVPLSSPILQAGVLVCLLAGQSLAQSLAQDLSWPDYRGPGHQGQVEDAKLPLRWSETSNIAWKTPVFGRAWSSPVIGGDEIWLTTATPDGSELYVLTASLKTGELVREELLFVVDEPQSIRNKMNSYASPSPVLEKERVYVHFGTAGSACVERKTGDVIWERRDILCEHLEGPGSSPILYGDLLIFNVDGADVQFVIALDKRTGKTVWKTERSTELDTLEPDLRKAYATPILVRVEEHDELISTGAAATMGYDPKSGKELWRIDHPGFSMSARPVTGAGLIFINTGYMRPQMWAIRAGGQGDVSESHVAWKCTKRVPEMSSAVFAGGRLFMANDAGVATCLEASSGDVIWQERIGGEHSASPVHSDGRIYFFDREGNTKVIAASAKFEILAENSLEDGFFASPAIAQDAFILRTKTHLYRVQD